MIEFPEFDDGPIRMTLRSGDAVPISFTSTFVAFDAKDIGWSPSTMTMLPYAVVGDVLLDLETNAPMTSERMAELGIVFDSEDDAD